MKFFTLKIIFIIIFIFSNRLFSESNTKIIKLNKESFLKINEEFQYAFARPERSFWNEEMEKVFKEGYIYELECPVKIAASFPYLKHFEDQDLPNDIRDKRLRITIACDLDNPHGESYLDQLYIQTFYSKTKLSPIFGAITSDINLSFIEYDLKNISNGSFDHQIWGNFKIKFEIKKILWCKKDECKLNPSSLPLCSSRNQFSFSLCFSKENFDNFYHIFISIIEVKPFQTKAL